MFEDRQTRPFETRIWSFVAPIEEDPVGSRWELFLQLKCDINSDFQRPVGITPLFSGFKDDVIFSTVIE